MDSRPSGQHPWWLIADRPGLSMGYIPYLDVADPTRQKHLAPKLPVLVESLPG